MSVNWGKYSSIEETREQGRKPPENAVVQLLVGNVRSITPLRVDHSPDFEHSNRSHCDVAFPEQPEDITEVRRALLEIATIVAELPS